MSKFFDKVKEEKEAIVQENAKALAEAEKDSKLRIAALEEARKNIESIASDITKLGFNLVESITKNNIFYLYYKGNKIAKISYYLAANYYKPFDFSVEYSIDANSTFYFDKFESNLARLVAEAQLESTK